MSAAMGQRGATLLELLLALAITLLIAVPLSSWTWTTLRHQRGAAEVLANTTDAGRVGRAFTRDVASARSITTSGGDCTGGGAGAGGTVRLSMQASGAHTHQTVYTEAPTDPADPGGGSSLWRRVCLANGSLVGSTELFSGVVPGTVAVTCPTTEVAGPVSPCASPVNRRVVLQWKALTYNGPATRPVRLVATRRADVGSVGVATSGNRPPIAQLVVDRQVGFVDQAFSFDASASEDIGGSIASYEWEFPTAGAPELKSGASVAHSFSSPGEKTVLLKVTDDEGETSSAAITVRVVNRYPVARVAISPTGGVRGTQVFTFDGSESFDPDDPARTLTYRWDLGPDLGAARHRTEAVFDYTFPADATPGLRQITLTVTDNLGDTDTVVRQVRLLDPNEVPFEIRISPEPVLSGAPAPTVGSVGGNTPSFEARFSVAEGAPLDDIEWVLVRASDGAEVATGTGSVWAHTFVAGQGGEYRVLRRTGSGNQVGDEVRFHINNAPVARIVVPAGGGAAPRVVDLRSSGSTDADGDALSYRWNLGFFDRWTSTTVNPTHLFTHPGRYTLQLTAVDAFGAEHTVSTELVVDGAPATPPAPRWVGGNVDFDPVPGAVGYRVLLRCGAVPATPPFVEISAAAAPVHPAAGFCPGGVADAAVAVGIAGPSGTQSTVWGPASTPGVRP